MHSTPDRHRVEGMTGRGTFLISDTGRLRLMAASCVTTLGARPCSDSGHEVLSPENGVKGPPQPGRGSERLDFGGLAQVADLLAVLEY